MHFPFDSVRYADFKHTAKVMHFPFDSENFPFDSEISVTPLVTMGYFLANSISNIYN